MGRKATRLYEIEKMMSQLARAHEGHLMNDGVCSVELSFDPLAVLCAILLPSTIPPDPSIVGSRRRRRRPQLPLSMA
jgi:hypothetical protein